MHGDARLLSSLMITEQCPLQLGDMHISQACSDVATFHIGALSLAPHPLLPAFAPHSGSLLHVHMGKEYLCARLGLPDSSHSNKTCTAVWDSGLSTALDVVHDSTANTDREEMSDPAPGNLSVESDGSSPATNVQWERRKALLPSMDAKRTPPPVPPKPRFKYPRKSPEPHQGCTGPGKEVLCSLPSPCQNSPAAGKTQNHKLVVEDPMKGAISTTQSNKQNPPESYQVIGRCLGFNHGSNSKPEKDCHTVAGAGSSALLKTGQMLSQTLLRPCPPPKPLKLLAVLQAADEMPNLSKVTSSASQLKEGLGNGNEKTKEDQVEGEHFKVVSVVALNSSQLGERATSEFVPFFLGQEAGRLGGGSTGGRVAPFPKPPRRKRQQQTEIQTPQAQDPDSGRRGREGCSLTKDVPVTSLCLPKTSMVEAVKLLEEPREVPNLEIIIKSIQSQFEDPLDGETNQGPMLKMVDTLEERKEHKKQTEGQQEEVSGERQALLQTEIQTPQVQALDSGRRDGEACPLTKDAPVASTSLPETFMEEADRPLEEPQEVQNVGIRIESIQNRFEDQGPMLELVDALEESKEQEKQTGGQREQVGGERQEGGEIPVGLHVFDCNHGNTEDESIYEDVNLPIPHAASPGNQTDTRRQEMTMSDGGPFTVPVTFQSRGKGYMSPGTLNGYETVEFVNPSVLPDFSHVKFVASSLDFSVQKYRIRLSRKHKRRPPWIRRFCKDPSLPTVASTYQQVFTASVFYKVADTDGDMAVTSQDAGTNPKPLVKSKMALWDKTKTKATQPKDKPTNRFSAPF